MDPMTARWTPRAIPLEPGNEDGPRFVVDVLPDLTISMAKSNVGGLIAMPPLVACQLGQALQDAAAWCGDRREARKR
jgi:hypothetical protein